MVLTTERLILTPLAPSDLGAFKACNHDPFVKKYLWDDQVMPAEVFEDILKEVESRFKNEKWGLWKITQPDDDTFLGYVGLWIFNPEKQPELLYALNPDFTGKGFAFEAAQKIIEYVFSDLGYDHLCASMDEPNVDSIRLAERLGMNFSHKESIEGKPTLFYKLERPTQ